MRVLVVSLNRSGSSVAAALAAATHGLVNYGEVFADDNPRSPRGDIIGHLLTADNYVGKIMMFVVNPEQFNYRTFDWSRIDRVILTTRKVEDQIASWLFVNQMYVQFTKGKNLSYQEHRNIINTFVGSLDLTPQTFPYIKAQFELFHEVSDFIHEHVPPERRCTIPFDVYTQENAAKRLSDLTGWDITPKILEDLAARKSNTDYRRQITNYGELAVHIQRHGITY